MPSDDERTEALGAQFVLLLSFVKICSMFYIQSDGYRGSTSGGSYLGNSHGRYYHSKSESL